MHQQGTDVLKRIDRLVTLSAIVMCISTLECYD